MRDSDRQTIVRDKQTGGVEGELDREKDQKSKYARMLDKGQF